MHGRRERDGEGLRGEQGDERHGGDVDGEGALAEGEAGGRADGERREQRPRSRDRHGVPHNGEREWRTKSALGGSMLQVCGGWRLRAGFGRLLEALTGGACFFLSRTVDASNAQGQIVGEKSRVLTTRQSATLCFKLKCMAAAFCPHTARPFRWTYGRWKCESPRECLEFRLLSSRSRPNG